MFDDQGEFIAFGSDALRRYAEMLDDEGKVDKESTKAGTAKLLVRMIVDEQGVALFHANEWPVIAAWDSLITEQLGDAARKHIGFDRDNEKKS